MQKGERMLREEVTDEDIAEIVSKWTGIPVTRMLEGEIQKLVQMEDACSSASSARTKPSPPCPTPCAARARDSRTRTGPSARSSSWGRPASARPNWRARWRSFSSTTRSAMVRIDMTEYMERHTVARLIGAPPGYVGYEEGGQLTEAVRRRPYAVVLFDEIEKAHPDVFNIAAADPRRRPADRRQGRTVDFKNTVIIMTSNIGAQYIFDYQKSMQTPQQEAEMERKVEEELHKHFRPEFLNRIDDVIIFHALDMQHIKRIIEIQLKRLAKMIGDRGLSIEISNHAKEQLAKEGYDPAFGARPLKRALQKLIIDPLAMKLLEGKFKPGDTVFVNVGEDGKIELSLEPEPVTVN